MSVSEQRIDESRLNIPQVHRQREAERGLYNKSAIRYAWLPPAFRGTDRDRAGIVTEYKRCGYDLLPVGELLAFTDIDVPIKSNDEGGSPNFSTGGITLAPPPVFGTKYAQEIQEDLEAAYGEWGLVFLPLTNLDAEDAFDAYRAVHPFIYTLAELEEELMDRAVERIAESGLQERRVAEPYFDQTGRRLIREVPLSTVAERVRVKMLAGLSLALTKRDQVLGDTAREMGERVGSKIGKIGPDPLDRHLYKQSGLRVPTNVTAQKETGDDTRQLIKMMAERMLKDEPQGEPQALEAIMGMLTEEREARKALEARLEEVASRKGKG